MLSTISPTFQAKPLLDGGADYGYDYVFPSSHGGFTAWENFESFFVSSDYKPDQDRKEQSINEPESKPNLKNYQVGLDSGLYDPNQKPLDFETKESGDHESPNQTSTLTSSGSDDPNQNFGGSNTGSSHYNDERKRKRMVSNRESARRSRMRKQNHIENLRNEANRLKLENEEGKNQLRLITHNINHVRSDNDRLRGESVILQRRLIELSQIMQIQQLHRINNNYRNHHDVPPCIPMQMIKPTTTTHKSLFFRDL